MSKNHNTEKNTIRTEIYKLVDAWRVNNGDDIVSEVIDNFIIANIDANIDELIEQILEYRNS